MTGYKSGRKSTRISIDRFRYAYIIMALINVIVLSTMLGSLGAGYMGITLFFFVVCTAPVSLWMFELVVKYVKGRTGRNQFISASHFYKAAIIVTLFYTTICVLILFLFGYKIGAFLFRDGQIGLCLWVMAPSIVVWSISHIICAYFCGIGLKNIIKIFWIVRQILIFVFSIVGFNMLSQYGTNVAALLKNDSIAYVYGATGAFAGFFAANILGLLILLLFFVLFHGDFHRKKALDVTKFPEKIGTSIITILVSSVTGFTRALFVAAPLLINEILYIRLQKSGMDSESWMTTGGSLFGSVLPFIGIVTLVVAFVPQDMYKQIAQHYKNNDDSLFREKVQGILYMLFTWGLLLASSLDVLAKPFLTLLKTDLTDATINGFTFAAILVFVCNVYLLFIKILQIVGDKLILFLGTLIGFIADIVVMIVLSKATELGFLLVILSFLIELVIVCAISFVALRRRIIFKGGFIGKIIMMIIIGLASALIMSLIYQLGVSKLAPVLSILICVIPGLLIYCIAMTFLRILNREDLKGMPLATPFQMLGSLLYRE